MDDTNDLIIFLCTVTILALFVLAMVAIYYDLNKQYNLKIDFCKDNGYKYSDDIGCYSINGTNIIKHKIINIDGKYYFQGGE